MTSLTFTVRDPISVNAMYGSNRKTRRRYLTPAGKGFKFRTIGNALEARAASEWPADPHRVAKARLSYQLYDYRGDTDGPRKALRDSLERVLFMNDRCVEDGPAPFAIRDGGGRRVVVTIELLEQRTKEEAEAERVAAAQREIGNGRRRVKARAKRIKASVRAA